MDPLEPVVADALVKTYGDLRAVDGVSLRVARGETFGLLGPNGAGKTTTLEMLEGLREPDAGTVRLLGESPWPRNMVLLPRIGVQLQATSFFERLTAREQLRAFASLYGVGAERVAETLALVGLAESAGTRTERLSGGQAQRLSIACAIVHDPELVFLDEPTTGLDPQARRNLWELIRAIAARGHTILLSTHHMDEAESLCDRVAIMDHGRILAMDSPARLVRGLDAPVRIGLVAGALPEAEARALPGVTQVRVDGDTLTIATRNPDAVLPEIGRRGALTGLRVHGATLEDVFLQLTGREYRE
ncbi:MAG: ABC transporter ATP-binding protein [Thermoleophilia bacterium]|nr:ABC transporter ATP-binding protein [Thermoleophilia bacterium]